MSDRIDELVRVAQGTFCWAQGSITFDNSNDYNAELDALVANREGFNTALTDLATIAREAEAMCEWLAGELYDEDYLGLYTRAARTSENEPYTPSDRVADIATIVATARAAIEQEEAE